MTATNRTPCFPYLLELPLELSRVMQLEGTLALAMEVLDDCLSKLRALQWWFNGRFH